MEYEYFSIAIIIIITLIILNYNNSISSFTNYSGIDSLIFDGRDTLDVPYLEETMLPVFV